MRSSQGRRAGEVRRSQHTVAGENRNNEKPGCIGSIQDVATTIRRRALVTHRYYSTIAGPGKAQSKNFCGYNSPHVTYFTLGCETARKRSVVVSGLRLHFLEWGMAGRPVLCFLHGGSAHAHWFDLVTPAFLDRFHVISLDQRGHGESQWAEPPAYATENFASDLIGLLDALGLARVTLVGHSMGGHNSMSFAAWHPDRVSALVIVDSRPTIPTDRLDRLRRRGERT